jgi:hypothetical protein
MSLAGLTSSVPDPHPDHFPKALDAFPRILRNISLFGYGTDTVACPDSAFSVLTF